MRAETVVTDGQFLLDRRPVRRPAAVGWRQPPPDTFPQREFALVRDREAGLAVFNRGLPEIAADRDGGGRLTLKLTLLRAVGWLSRDDFAARGFTNVGPTVPTPGAQCLGPQRARYAVLPVADESDAAVKQLSRRYRVPLLAVQGVATGALPEHGGLMRHEEDAVCVSAVKRHRARETAVVRLYNTGSEPVADRLVFGRRVAEAWITDLLEARQAPLEPADERSLVIRLAPHAIVTVEVAFAG